MLKAKWVCSLLILPCVLLVPVAHAQLPDFTGLVEQNNAAVVNISTTQKLAAREPQPPMPEGLDIPEGTPFDELLKRYFGEGGPGGPGGPNGPGGEEPDEGGKSLGSGFIISPDGYVITNHHVIRDADEVVVRLQDRRELVAKIVGSDKRSDIALLKLEAKDLPVVKLGSSEDLRVGEWVLAIGSPFGFDHSVTAGIVSAKGRSLPSDNYVPFIQTDVAINPGNSGGPLINLDGEVVGINSQIYSRTGGFMGLSFAIPIELAVNVADQLRDSGRVARGYLGVLIQDVDRNLAESFGMAQPHGALVSRVMPDSPADQAGLKVGDVILEFNGKPLLNSSQLPPMVGTARVEEKATLLLLRGGKEKEVAIIVGRLPDDEEEASALPAIAQPDDIAQLGLSVIDIEPQVRKELGLDETGGALVSKVSPGAAQEAGINRGDIVLMFDGVDVKNAKHLRELIDQAGDKRTVAVLIHRGDSPLFLALRLKD